MRVFLLSPANTGGVRAQLLLRSGSALELARRLERGEAELGETFAFLSSLYFRGKLAYARRFAAAEGNRSGAFVITTSRGLVPPEEKLSMEDLRELSRVNIDTTEPRYTEPLQRDLAALAANPRLEVVLLGSIATGKYVDLLVPLFGERAQFPSAFVGRGDMSRGGLMLRSAREGVELEYIPITGALRRGSRPPKLAPLPRASVTPPRKRKGRNEHDDPPP